MDSYDLQRFLNDHRDLLAWINSMLTLVSSEELANDVTGAEALIERHQVTIPNYYLETNITILHCKTHVAYSIVTVCVVSCSIIKVVFSV